MFGSTRSWVIKTFGHPSSSDANSITYRNSDGLFLRAFYLTNNRVSGFSVASDQCTLRGCNWKTAGEFYKIYGQGKLAKYSSESGDDIYGFTSRLNSKIEIRFDYNGLSMFAK